MVPITKVVAIIVAQGEAVPESYRKQMEEAIPTSREMVGPLPFHLGEKGPKVINAVPVARKMAEEKGVDLSLVTPTGPHGTIMKKDVETYLVSAIPDKRPQKASSLARKVAEEFKVPLDSIQGTGIQGRIVKGDVLKAVEQLEPVSKGEVLFGKSIPMNKIRQVIARRLSESAFTAPHIYLFIEISMERILHLRESILEDFEKQFNVRLSINDFLIKALASAIQKFPLLNAMAKGNEIYIHPEINIGLAVALKDGLIVPAIRLADKLGLGAIAQQRSDLVDRARKGKLTLDEIERGTFTISSLSNFDISFFTAILNPPQSGILSVGKIQDQLYLENGEVKAKKVTHFGLSVDHRIIDGALAAEFLQTVKKIVENPNFYFLNL
jgi:pyruvate dehydrogenase E2 component (dihydrolipoamide acetyltransferase)